jgi:hypothetical protein
MVVEGGVKRRDAVLAFLMVGSVQDMDLDAQWRDVLLLVVVVDYAGSMEVDYDVLWRGVRLAHNLEDYA